MDVAADAIAVMDDVAAPVAAMPKLGNPAIAVVAPLAPDDGPDPAAILVGALKSVRDSGCKALAVKMPELGGAGAAGSGLSWACCATVVVASVPDAFTALLEVWG